MIENKKFKKYNQQMKYLRNEKKIDCSGSVDKYNLVRYGYFNIINGYKDPFIARKDLDTDKHIYLRSAKLDDFLTVKSFDKKLRDFLFSYLTELEEEIRAVFAYAFDYKNEKGTVGWYELKAYNECDYTSQNIMRLISKIYSEVNNSKNDYLTHYLDNHKYVPTWILTKMIKFSTFIEFITYSKKDVIDAFQNLYGLENKKVLLSSLEWIRIVRNSCAHNERVFAIKNKSGKSKSKYIEELLPKSYKRVESGNLMNLFVYMKYFLPHKEYKEFILKIEELLLDVEDKIPPHSFDNVRANMGIKDVAHLRLLLKNPKEIEYNKFDKILNSL